MIKNKILIFESCLLIILIILYSLLEYLLKLNNLELMNYPRYIAIGIFIVLLILIVMQILILIYMSMKNKESKINMIITSIILSLVLSRFLVFVVVFTFIPPTEHIVEIENKKMVACVNGFTHTVVLYYDYINGFVRGYKLRIHEDYGSGGFDPFERDEVPVPKRSTHYDDYGNIIKSNESYHIDDK